MRLEVNDLRKAFGRFHALDGVSLTVDEGEFIALLGPSGSGKTTLLRIIAGLEFADPGAGAVRFDGEDVSRRPVGERGIGFVFQNYALFRHMTVFENVAFGLRVRPRSTRPDEATIFQRVGELLEFMQLPELAKRYPAQLSGGQRQRVAFARALAIDPKLLLLDEPFGALDAKVRKELRRWLREVQERLKLTTVLVTHDQEEALEIADRVVLMNAGRIEQIGTPQEVYDRPASPFVFEFLGDTNRLEIPAPARVSDSDIAAGRQRQPTRALHAYVRRHDVIIHRQRNPGAAGSPPMVEAIVRRVLAAGSTARVELDRVDTGETLEAELTRREESEYNLRPGEHVFLELRNVQSVAAPDGGAQPEWSI